MSWISYTFIPILSLALALLDTSYFSFYEILGATVLSSFGAVLIISVLGFKKQALLFSATAVLWLTAFSSLSVYILIAAFMGVPLLIFYIRNKVFFESSLPITLIIFFAANLAFRLMMLPLKYIVSGELISSVVFFPILNTIFCLIFFVLCKKILTYFRV